MTDWNNHIMRKFGGSIRANISEAYYPYVKACIIVTIEKREVALDKMISDLPKEKWEKG